MGVASYIIGYIEEAWPGGAGGGDPSQIQLLKDTAASICQHTDDILSSLPEHDAFPPITREMVACASARSGMITYKNRLIHFGASLKDFEWSLRDWLDKFEALLRRLYWEQAYVRIETGYLGIHEFQWRPPDEWVSELCKGRLTPITNWVFESTMESSELETLRETHREG